MASRWFIINEWLFSNLSCEKDSKRVEPEDLEELKRKKEQSVSFLQIFFDSKEDGIVLLRNSPWLTKAYRWADRANKTSIRDRDLSKRFFKEFLLQPRRYKYVEEDDIKDLPPKLRRLIRTHKDDEIDEYINDEDEYLLLTWLSSQVEVECIVTTDTRLQQALAKHYPEIRTLHRDEFLASYPTMPPTS